MSYVIVVGTDGSANAQQAVGVAADLAHRASARVVLVHAFQPLAHLDEMSEGTSFADIEDLSGDHLAGQWAEPLRNLGVEFETRIAHGLPADVLLDTAEEVAADLIVVGFRGLDFLKKITLGSTSSKVVAESIRPVVVVPHPSGDRHHR